MYGNVYHGVPNHNGPSPSVEGIRGNGGTGSNDVMSMMNERDAVALLQHLDKTELEHLLQNDSKLKDLVDDLAQVSEMMVLG